MEAKCMKSLFKHLVFLSAILSLTGCTEFNASTEWSVGTAGYCKSSEALSQQIRRLTKVQMHKTMSQTFGSFIKETDIPDLSDPNPRIGFHDDPNILAIDQINIIEYHAGIKKIVDIAHYNEEVRPGSRLAFEGWTEWYIQKIVNFVKELATTDDVGGGKLLDNTLIVLTGEVADGSHIRSQGLYMTIGGGNRLKKGRWMHIPRVSVTRPMGFNLRALNPDGTMHTGRIMGNNHLVVFSIRHAADLWTRVGQLMGLDITKFGDYIHNVSPLDL